MGIYFGMALIVGVFSGLYFTYGADQLAMMQEEKVSVAEIFKRCHDAAVSESRTNAALGSGATDTRTCTGTGATALTNPTAAGLNVPQVIIEFHNGVDVGMAGTSRAVVTFLPNTGTINAVPFNDAQEQLGKRFYGDPSVGTVQAGPPPFIESVAGMQVTVPTSVPVGSIAMVTAINP